MKRCPLVRAGLAIVTLLACHTNAAAQIRLAPSVKAGDDYRLVLETTTETDASSRGPERQSFEEQVKLRYEARVVVLEAHEGRAVRELHEGVTLTFQRPDDSGSLFRTGTRYEVERSDEGAVRVLTNGARIDTRVEKLVAPLLERQFEYTLGPELLDPGREVAVGETWTLSERVARRLLEANRLTAIEFDGPPMAELVRHPDDDEARQIRYRIPIGWCETDEMPASTEPSKTSAVLVGELDLAPGTEGRAVRHDVQLELRMRGVVAKRGVARSFPFELDRFERAEQHVEWFASQGIAERDLPAAAPPASPAALRR